MPARHDYAAIAEQAIAKHRPLLALEFHPAAIAAVDTFIDLSWGDGGAAPGDDAWKPEPAKWTAIVAFGAFLGELIRREHGGEWREKPARPGDALAASVVLRDGAEVFPISKAYRRFRDGAGDRLEPLYLLVRRQSGRGPDAAEAEGWMRQARHFESVGRPDFATLFADRALALSPTPALRAEIEGHRARWARSAADEAGRQHRAQAQAEPAESSRGEAAPHPPAPAPVAPPPAPVKPRPSEAHRRRAEDLAAGGRHEEALAAFEQSLDLDPASPDGLLGKARALLALGRVAEAREWLADFSGRHDCEPEAAWLAALAADAAADVVEAHRLHARLKDEPRLSDDRRATAAERCAALAAEPAVRQAAIEALPDLASAVSTYARLVADHPEFADGWREQGVGQAMLGRLDEAVACLRRASALEPAEPKSYDHEAVALMRFERYDEALAAIERGLRCCPASGTLLMRKAACLSLAGRLTDALATCEAALAADPGYPETWAFKGDIEQKLGRTREAVASLQRYLTARPGSREKRVELARRQLWGLRNPGRRPDRDAAQDRERRAIQLALAGQGEAALALFDGAVADDPLYPEAWLNRGTCLARLERFDLALASFARAEELGLASSALTESIAACLVRLDRADEAPAAWDRLLARGPRNLEALHGKARALARDGRPADALPLYQRLRARAPANEAIAVERAEVLRALGRDPEAEG